MNIRLNTFPFFKISILSASRVALILPLFLINIGCFNAVKEKGKIIHNNIDEKSFTLLAEEHLKKGLSLLNDDEGMENSLLRAAREFADSIFFNPQLAEAHLNLGLSYFYLNELKLAVKRFEYIVAHFSGPLRGKAYYNLGVIYHNQGNVDKSFEYFLSAKENNMNKASFIVADILKIRGMYSEAEQEYREIISGNPENPEAYIQLGALYIDRGEYYYEKAKDSFLEAVKREPDDPQIYFNLGTLYYNEGNLTGSLKMFKKTLSLQPDSLMVNFNLAKLFYETGNIGESLIYFKRASQFGHRESLFAIARIYNKQEQPEKGLEVIEKILEKDSKNAPAYMLRGIFYHKLKNYIKAKQAYQKAVKISSNNFTAYNNLAVLYRETGKFDKSLSLFKKLILKNPKFWIAHKNIGILYEIYLNKLDKAEYHYKKYLKDKTISTKERKRVKKWINEIQKRKKENKKL